jgi:hypothetical protein
VLVETTTSIADRKLATLLLLGQSLDSYSLAHERYSALIHDPDSKVFAAEWEASLYGPVRRIVNEVLWRGRRDKKADLLYCAPGAHAPLLSSPSEGESLCGQLATVSLADIDYSALIAAARTVAGVAPHAAIRSAAVDFTGGLGQRFVDVLRSALEAADDLKALERTLASAEEISDVLFTPAVLDQAKEVLNSTFDQAGIGSEHDLAVSEMVGSFTGVPAWMAFRSAVLAAFPDSDTHAIAKCMNAAWDLLRAYNRRFLQFHLEALASRTARGGVVVAVFDATKRFDEESFGVLLNLPTDFALEGLGPRGVMLEALHRLIWRDHPHSIPLRIGGFPIVDFCAHSHDINVLVFRVTAERGCDGCR